MEQKEIGRKALKAGTWYTISNIILKCISIITTPLYTRMMSTKDYGTAATYNSWMTILLVICTMNLAYSIGRAKIDFPGKLEEYVGSMQVLSLLVTMGLSTIAVIFINPLSAVMAIGADLIIILIINLLSASSVQFIQSKYRYEYKYKENIAITIIIAVGTVALTFLLLYLLKDKKYLAKVLGAVIPTVCIAIFVWIRAIKKRVVIINKKYWKYGLLISSPLIIHTISLSILGQSDRILIAHYCGQQKTGIYSLVYSYAILITVIMNSVSQAWLPWFHDTYNNKEYNLIKQKCKPLVILGCLLGVGCIALGPEAVLVLGGKKYYEGIWAVPPITLGVVCQYIYTHYVNVQMTLKKTKYVPVGTIIAAVVNIVLNIIFIPMFGFVAAAYTTLVGYFLLMIIHYCIDKFILKVDIYDNKFMFLSFIVTCAVVMVFNFTYSKEWSVVSLLVRIGVMLVILLACWLKYRKVVMELIESKRQSRKNR